MPWFLGRPPLLQSGATPSGNSMKKIMHTAGISARCWDSQTVHRIRWDNKMYGANNKKREKITENCFRDARTSSSKIVMVNIYLIVTWFCHASLNALQMLSFKWNKIFLGCASVQIELRLLTSDILKVLNLTYHLQRPIKHSIIFFKPNHYSFTGVTLTDTYVREELSLDAYRKGFQFIHFSSVLVFRVKLPFGILLLLFHFYQP